MRHKFQIFLMSNYCTGKSEENSYQIKNMHNKFENFVVLKILNHGYRPKIQIAIKYWISRISKDSIEAESKPDKIHFISWVQITKFHFHS